MYLLDTNHCTFIFVEENPDVLELIANSAGKEFSINSIIYGELILMAEKSERREENLEDIKKFINSIPEFIYPIDKETSKIYGNLYAKLFNYFAPKDKKLRRKYDLKNAGIRINDLWIACTAIQYNLTVLSQDSDFNIISKVVPLKVECWKKQTEQTDTKT